MDVHNINDTVAAMATAPGQAGIAVVRVSGDGAFEAADTLCGGAEVLPSGMEAGTFRLFALRDPDGGAMIDEAVVLAFRAPHSYTGEDVVEFQTHGGRMSAMNVLSALSRFGVRMAEPGEFTRRAFLNGRIDLSRAEAVMDMIGAQSERAARSAAEQLAGTLGEIVDGCYDALMDVCADIEASLDFMDDEASDVLEPADVPARLEEIAWRLDDLASTWQEGHMLREGALVVLSGVPNSGKSTLFNALLGKSRSIVTEIPGTTRDSIEEGLVLGGIPLRLVDTAGLRETHDTIEKLGIDRTERLVDEADLNLLVVDAADGEWMPPAGAPDDGGKARTVVVLNKIDIAPRGRVETLPREVAAEVCDAVCISATTGEGIPELKALITQKLCGGFTTRAGLGVAVSTRHHGCIMHALDAIGEAMELYGDGDGGDFNDGDIVLCAQLLRTAAESLAAITGRIYSEDLLDGIFSRFCIGK